MIINAGTIALFFLFLITSCNKEAGTLMPDETGINEPVDRGPLSFDVQADQNTPYKVGDTVKFNVSGNADLVSFYSGTVGNNYDYRDQDRYYDVAAGMSFESSKTPANSTNIDCAELLYTTDLKGYSYNDVKSANWIALTSRFFLQSELQASASNYAPSGVADISDVFEAGKPVYFAWRCKTAAASYRTQFRVQNFKLDGTVIGDATLSGQLYSQMQFGFQWVQNEASATQGSNLPTVTSTLLTWNGVFNNTTGPYKEGYAVSGPIELPRFNAGKDKPVVIVTKPGATGLQHKYVYDHAGAYEVVFVASRTNDSGQQDIIKKVTVNVEP